MAPAEVGIGVPEHRRAGVGVAQLTTVLTSSRRTRR
jgi:hypothetical protein